MDVLVTADNFSPSDNMMQRRKQLLSSQGIHFPEYPESNFDKFPQWYTLDKEHAINTVVMRRLRFSSTSVFTA